MRTAIIKTDFWEDDRIFELNTDTRTLYLCLLTNPKRDITPAFKCSDRMLVAYTGYDSKIIDICRQQLIQKGLISYISDYYILTNQDYVQPSKGRDTKVIFDRYLSSLPKEILDFLYEKKLVESTSTSTGTTSGTSTRVIDKDKDKDIVKDKYNVKGAEVLKTMTDFIDPKNKLYYGNKTQRSACDFLIEEYGFENVIKAIKLLPEMKKQIPYFPTITTPIELRDKWKKIEDALLRVKVNTESKKTEVVFGN